MLHLVSDQPAPPEIVALAEARSRARGTRDWREADELRTRIEAGGWRVVDVGTDFSLWPAHPPDTVTDGRTFHGSVDSVPSRLDEPASSKATIVLVVEEDGDALDAALEALAAHAPADAQVIVVAPGDRLTEARCDEIVGTVQTFSPGDALQAAIRRASGSVIVVMEPDRIPTRDVVGPLLEGLEDPMVAVIGIEGLLSADLRRYHPAQTGDATVLRSGCYAFRRDDAIARGPIDGRLHLAGSVAAWWSLLLRDEGPHALPRRAVAVDLPLERREGEAPALPADHARSARRDAYRIADRFRGHDWLALADEEVRGVPGDGPDGDHHDDDPEERGDAADAE